MFQQKSLLKPWGNIIWLWLAGYWWAKSLVAGLVHIPLCRCSPPKDLEGDSSIQYPLRATPRQTNVSLPHIILGPLMIMISNTHPFINVVLGVKHWPPALVLGMPAVWEGLNPFLFFLLFLSFFLYLVVAFAFAFAFIFIPPFAKDFKIEYLGIDL